MTYRVWFVVDSKLGRGSHADPARSTASSIVCLGAWAANAEVASVGSHLPCSELGSGRVSICGTFERGAGARVARAATAQRIQSTHAGIGHCGSRSTLAAALFTLRTQWSHLHKFLYTVTIAIAVSCGARFVYASH